MAFSWLNLFDIILILAIPCLMELLVVVVVVVFFLGGINIIYHSLTCRTYVLVSCYTKVVRHMTSDFDVVCEIDLASFLNAAPCSVNREGYDYHAGTQSVITRNCLIICSCHTMLLQS